MRSHHSQYGTKLMEDMAAEKKARGWVIYVVGFQGETCPVHKCELEIDQEQGRGRATCETCLEEAMAWQLERSKKYPNRPISRRDAA